jgi:hypothetical protein
MPAGKVAPNICRTLGSQQGGTRIMRHTICTLLPPDKINQLRLPSINLKDLSQACASFYISLLICNTGPVSYHCIRPDLYNIPKKTSWVNTRHIGFVHPKNRVSTRWPADTILSHTGFNLNRIRPSVDAHASGFDTIFSGDTIAPLHT